VNVVLSTLQVVLALHTAIGATWKWANSSQQTMPSLAAIPHGVWVALSVPELFCAIAFIIPLFDKRAAILAPIAALFVACEMVLFSAVHLASGATSIGPVIYWLSVAAICAFVVYGRLVLKPIRRGEFA
jgi:hypothetical protein